MADIATLLAEHDVFERLASRLAAVMARDGLDVPAVVDMRGQLHAALQAHLASEDREIYPSLINAPDEAAVEAGRSFLADFAALSDRWTGYIETWPAERIAAEPAAFRDDTRVILHETADRITRENEELYPLVLRFGLLRLRAGR